MRIGSQPPLTNPQTTNLETPRRVPARLGDGVLYVGMNSTLFQNDAEAALLQRTGPGARRAITHGERTPDVGSDHARLADGTLVALGTPDGSREFAASLALDHAQTDALSELLLAAPAGSRDELAALASAFAIAERGGDVPSRIVLSGHCTGSSIYDGAGLLGEVRFDDVLAIARIMPRASEQIEDIMLSACSSGYDGQRTAFTMPMSDWQECFPNLKTVWGYGGERDFHSPTGRTALEHIEAWELATRGRAARLEPKSALARVSGGEPIGYGANVSVWSVRQGYVRGK